MRCKNYTHKNKKNYIKLKIKIIIIKFKIILIKKLLFLSFLQLKIINNLIINNK